MSENPNEFLWVEKYRPKKIDDIVLSPKMKAVFNKIVEDGELPHMLFTGPAGTGKTTLAKALCIQLNLDYMMINGSEEGNIDTLRTKIKRFASTVSLSDSKYKVVILDEADYLNAQSFQPALRGFMQDFSKTCRFILTCNFKNRIIEPLHSRCSVYDFTMSKAETTAMAKMFIKRAASILTEEGVKYEPKVLVDFVLKRAPDWRKILVDLQNSSLMGEINESTVATQPTKFNELFECLKSKNFKQMRQWVVNNIDTDSSAIIRGLYDQMQGNVKNKSVPALILILGEYQYKAAFVADQELNMVAMMVEIMSNVEFE